MDSESEGEEKEEEGDDASESGSEEEKAVSFTVWSVGPSASVLFPLSQLICALLPPHSALSTVLSLLYCISIKVLRCLIHL